MVVRWTLTPPSPSRMPRPQGPSPKMCTCKAAGSFCCPFSDRSYCALNPFLDYQESAKNANAVLVRKVLMRKGSRLQTEDQS